MAVTEDILVRLRVQGQTQFASAMGGAATQTERLGGAAKTTGKQVDDTGKKAKTAGGQVRGFAGGVAKFAGAAAALAAAQKVVRDSVTNAVDLGEQINKTAVVFRGPGAKSIQDWSKTTATALGISREQALESAGTLGNMLVPMGVGRQRAADMSKSFVNLASDMASFNNATPEETLDALRSGLAGESEPLRKFGVFLNEARIKQEAMRQGLYKGKGPLDAQAKALATSAIIAKDTADAHGDFARTSDSLANKQRVLRAQYENATAAIGQKLIPILSTLANNLDTVAIVVGAIAAAWLAWSIGAAIAATSTGTLTGAVAALGAAILANPIGLIAIALIALVAGIVIAYRKVGWFRKGIDALWDAIKTAFGWIKSHWPLILSILTGPFGALVIYVIRHWDKVLDFLKSLPGKIASAASGMWDGIKNGFRSVINTIIGWWNGLEFKVPGIDKGPIHIGGFTLGLPDLPTLAAGGTITAGGAAVVGEAGPELVTLPAGAGVTPLSAPIHTHVYLNGREIATAVGNAAADRRARR
jgi:hypothetical protein